MQRPLYGGMCSAVLPQSFTDLSCVRGLADHEELFGHPDSDLLIHVELLARPDRPGTSEPTAAAVYHYEVVARENKATCVAPTPVELTTSVSGVAAGVVGVQEMVRRNDKETTAVRVYLGLIRLAERPIDILVTFSCPVSQDSAEITNMWKQATETFKVNDYGLFA